MDADESPSSVATAPRMAPAGLQRERLSVMVLFSIIAVVPVPVEMNKAPASKPPPARWVMVLLETVKVPAPWLIDMPSARFFMVLPEITVVPPEESDRACPVPTPESVLFVIVVLELEPDINLPVVPGEVKVFPVMVVSDPRSHSFFDRALFNIWQVMVFPSVGCGP
jgi:hypothetical protein